MTDTHATLEPAIEEPTRPKEPARRKRRRKPFVARWCHSALGGEPALAVRVTVPGPRTEDGRLTSSGFEWKMPKSLALQLRDELDRTLADDPDDTDAVTVHPGHDDV